jgi:hypothetical protein
MAYGFARPWAFIFGCGGSRVGIVGRRVAADGFKTLLRQDPYLTKTLAISILSKLATKRNKTQSIDKSMARQT